MNDKRKQEIYAAIHGVIVDFRIAEKFEPNLDHRVAQLELKIWDRVKPLLETKKKEPRQ